MSPTVTELRFWRDHDLEATLHANLEANGWPPEQPRPLVYVTAGGHRALVGREPAGGLPSSPLRWHISLQGPGRVPAWEELAGCAHELRPGVPFVVAVPPRSWWLNLHPHVLHLWETADEALIAEWRANARGDRRT